MELGYKAVELSSVSEAITLACEVSSWAPVSLCGLWVIQLWVRNLVTLHLELHPHPFLGLKGQQQGPRV